MNTVASTLHSIRSANRRSVRSANSSASRVRTNRTGSAWPACLARRVRSTGHLLLDAVGQAPLTAGDGVVAHRGGRRRRLASLIRGVALVAGLRGGDLGSFGMALRLPRRAPDQHDHETAAHDDERYLPDRRRATAPAKTLDQHRDLDRLPPTRRSLASGS